jgi:hypothetical protein
MCELGARSGSRRIWEIRYSFGIFSLGDNCRKATAGSQIATQNFWLVGQNLEFRNQQGRETLGNTAFHWDPKELTLVTKK